MIAFMFAALAVLGIIAVLGTACAVRAWLRDQAAERAAFALEVHHVTYLPLPEHLPAPVTEGTLPIRGDAQEREGGCAPAEPRPAAGADLTGLLSPRTHQEGTPLLSAPPAGSALLPAPVTEEVMHGGSAADSAAWGQGLRVNGAGGARPSPALSKAVTDALDAGWAIARSMTAVTG